MRMLGGQFVLGADHRGGARQCRGGDGARATASPSTCWARRRAPQEDAERYAARYHGRGRGHRGRGRARRRARDDDELHRAPRPLGEALGAASALSSLRKEERVSAELLPRCSSWRVAMRERGLPLTIDAEEADRLELSLALLRSRSSPIRRSPAGTGSASRCRPTEARAAADRLACGGSPSAPAGASRCGWSRAPTGTARSSGRRSAGSPAIRCSPARSTPTSPTSPARARCSRGPTRFYPQFATHNAHTRRRRRDARRRTSHYEFQRLHGMGEALLSRGGAAPRRSGKPCRIYAPVGGHEDLLAYLVRRLLENGANTSFVNRLVDDEAPIAAIVADPVEKAAAASSRRPIRGSRCRADLFVPSGGTVAGLPLSEAGGPRAAAARDGRGAGDARRQPARSSAGEDGWRRRRGRRDHLAA